MAARATHWSIRSAAAKTGIHRSTVQRYGVLFGVPPHRTKAFTLSTDPFFVEKVRDIVGLYLNPPDHALVLAVDEKSQIQALERTAPILPMGLGYVEGVTHDSLRHGPTTRFAALDVQSGRVITQRQPRHRHQEFLRFLEHLDTHVRAWLAKRPRYQVHFTPTYSAWLNHVERWTGLITQRVIRRGSYRRSRNSSDASRPSSRTTTAPPRPSRGPRPPSRSWRKSNDLQQASLRHLGLLEYKLSRRDELDRQIVELALTPPVAAAVQRLQCFRGLQLHGAMVLATELVDWRRFDNPRQLMAYLGLVLRERSSGDRERRGSLTKAGNSHCRHVLVQAAWAYRFQPKIGVALKARQRGQSPVVIAHAWKAQHRLHTFYRRLAMRTRPQIAVVAVARELVGFLWAVMQEETPIVAAA